MSKLDKKIMTLEFLVSNLELLKNLNDIVRVVDPVRKQVLDIKEDLFLPMESNCYDFWQTNKICENCISVRAYKEEDSFVKIEFNGTNVYMITAYPIFLKDRTVVLEILKDITNKGIIDNIENKSSSTIYDVIANMNKLVVKDELTEIFNRRYINETLPVEIVKTVTEGSSLSVILADIDYFKKVNDNYGHLAGDYILKEYAHILNKIITVEDGWVSRFGGEEFLICLRKSKEEAFLIAEKLRTTVERRTFIYEASTINITSSFGICTTKNKMVTPEELIDSSDKALYEAKNTGRNKVNIYEL